MARPLASAPRASRFAVQKRREFELIIRKTIGDLASLTQKTEVFEGRSAIFREFS